MKLKRKQIHLFSLLAIGLTLAFSAMMVLPEDADARFGRGRSFGSRGGKSFSTPRQDNQKSSFQRNRQRSDQRQNSGGFGRSALMGGIGGFMMGGLLGSMLFGGMGGGMGGGGGMGLLDILLIGGGLYLLYRYMKNRKKASLTSPDGSSKTATGDFASLFSPSGREASQDHHDDASTFSSSHGAHGSRADDMDEVSRGLERVHREDPNFDEQQFLDGARRAFEQIQSAWSDWSVDRLRPLLTDRMWEMVTRQANELKAAKQRNVIEKILFEKVVISEVWQESGIDYIVVHYTTQMIDTVTDIDGNLQDGDPHTPIRVEEYWTFIRPVGATSPNWHLSAIQQPGEVARSTF